MLKHFRDMMVGAVLTFVAMFASNSFAVLTLPDFNGPYLGDQNTNLYTVAQAINQWRQQQTTSGLTALAGGGQTGATRLGYGFNQITVVATAADSVQLPPCNVGAAVYVTNDDSTDAMTVFGAQGRSDTINGTAGATGVSQVAGAHAIYFCAVPDATTANAGKWTSIRATS